jgi:hypothetical protein
MSSLKETIDSFNEKVYKRVQRNADAYSQCEEFTTSELNRLVDMYRNTVFGDDMRARLIRDSIDHHVRRYHKYAIQGNIGSHYREVGVVESDSTFEHVIPASSVRDLLIEEHITIKQALNTPTCLVKRTSDKTLTENGLVSINSNNWFFFRRYNVLNSAFTTYNGQAIADLETWNLQNHFDFFGIV